MYCRACGVDVDENTAACMDCGCDPHRGKEFCNQCGKETAEKAVVCLSCGCSLAVRKGQGDGPERMTVALLAIFLGPLGVHKFIMGYKTEGIILLLGTLLTCTIGAIITSPLTFIEGIIYLTKTDEEFTEIYINGNKPWL